ncbi:MAG TPA: squalene synthase HpnC [Dongiaceae bacterium]|jgi:squalene synthase HpnC
MTNSMSTAGAVASGKGHRDENFPVASGLISPRHRGIVLAFYRFARVADDVADHASLKPDEKLALLGRMEETLLGRSDSEADALPLRTALAARGMSPRHPLDLLKAFRLDVTKLRYRDWDDLMEYCRYSASPVGRFVLDVHGESEATWPANDALCSALQVINHLQDCAKDYRNLDRVYIPLDIFDIAGLTPEVLMQAKAPAALLAGIRQLNAQTIDLLRLSSVFSRQIADLRLALEVAVIQRLALTLTGMLTTRDPLSENVHLGKAGAAGVGALGMAQGLALRLLRLVGAKPAGKAA